MIEIRSKQEGFRRAGVAHSVTPKQYRDDAFTEAQLEQLEAEPMLSVRFVEDKAAEKTEKAPVKETAKEPKTSADKAKAGK